MGHVTADELMRYIEGEVEDPVRITEIQDAIHRDPPLAEQYDRLQASMLPSAEVSQWIGAAFARLASSIWIPLRRPDSPGDGMVGTLQLPLAE